MIEGNVNQLQRCPLTCHPCCADSEASCRKGISPWYVRAAEQGSAAAQDALSELYQVTCVDQERAREHEHE